MILEVNHPLANHCINTTASPFNYPLNPGAQIPRI